MAEYDNTNRGVLFRNDRKQSDRHPDYTGSITLADGEEYYLDAWKNVSKAGKPYLSVKIGSPKGRQPGDDDHKGDPSAPTPAPRGASAAAEFDDEIPFSPW